jgi:hypothetical protein
MKKGNKESSLLPFFETKKTEIWCDQKVILLNCGRCLNYDFCDSYDCFD